MDECDLLLCSVVGALYEYIRARPPRTLRSGRPAERASSWYREEMTTRRELPRRAARGIMRSSASRLPGPSLLANVAEEALDELPADADASLDGLRTAVAELALVDVLDSEGRRTIRPGPHEMGQHGPAGASGSQLISRRVKRFVRSRSCHSVNARRGTLLAA